ncbi:MAG: CADD family putative folate metabolism protein [Acidobacteria bacterium]|nr:CADD family putative folate metabolism protein [Acidobacteriota bacterium]
MKNHDGEALVTALDALIQKHHLLQHPFYQAWTKGTLTRASLQLYAAQYYKHVEAFPQHLRRLATRTEGELRSLIEENLAEEENPRLPHPKLWRDFAASLDVEGATLDSTQPLPGTQALVDTFQQISEQGTPTEAVAAFYAYESQVPEIATRKIDGLRRFYNITEPRSLAYFAVHEEADVRHRQAWRTWLAQQSGVDTEAVLHGAERALRALWGALDAVSPESYSQN